MWQSERSKNNLDIFNLTINICSKVDMTLMKNLSEYSEYESYYYEDYLRIVNGYEAPRRPWQAFIQVTKQDKVKTCGGFLINRR